VVPVKDDLLSAMRYAALSVERYGERMRNQAVFRKYNFDSKIEYASKGIV
jgi:hypothetical protein